MNNVMELEIHDYKQKEKENIYFKEKDGKQTIYILEEAPLGAGAHKK